MFNNLRIGILETTTRCLRRKKLYEYAFTDGPSAMVKLMIYSVEQKIIQNDELMNNTNNNESSPL